MFKYEEPTKGITRDGEGESFEFPSIGIDLEKLNRLEKVVGQRLISLHENSEKKEGIEFPHSLLNLYEQTLSHTVTFLVEAQNWMKDDSNRTLQEFISLEGDRILEKVHSSVQRNEDAEKNAAIDALISYEESMRLLKDIARELNF